MSWYLPSSTTPPTSTKSMGTPSLRRKKRCPIADELPHIFRAKVWLTIAMCGVVVLSCHEKSRPETSRVSAASKYPADMVNAYRANTELFTVNSFVLGGKTGTPRGPLVKGTLL